MGDRATPETCEVCGREKMPPCPHQSVEAGSMRCLSCGKTLVGNPPVFEQAPAPANPCKRGHYADGAIYAAECYSLGYARERTARQAAEARADKWKRRAKKLAAIAQEHRFTPVASSIRLGALESVIAPAEMEDFNARIKARTAERRAALAAMRSAETALSLVSGALADCGAEVGPAIEFGASLRARAAEVERERDEARGERDNARADAAISHDMQRSAAEEARKAFTECKRIGALLDEARALADSRLTDAASLRAELRKAEAAHESNWCPERDRLTKMLDVARSARERAEAVAEGYGHNAKALENAIAAAEARATAAEAKLRTAEEALGVAVDAGLARVRAAAAFAALRSQEAPAAGADPAQRVAIGCWYRHRKGGLYVVEDVALESTNGRPRERVVVYRGTQGLNVRTEREFFELVDGEPRFALTSDPPYEDRVKIAPPPAQREEGP